MQKGIKFDWLLVCCPEVVDEGHGRLNSLGLTANRLLDLWIIDSSYMVTCWTRLLAVATKLWFKLSINQSLCTRSLFLPVVWQLISEKVVYITANSPALAECHISTPETSPREAILYSSDYWVIIRKVFTTHPETWGRVGLETVIKLSVHRLHISDNKTNLIKCIYWWKDLRCRQWNVAHDGSTNWANCNLMQAVSVFPLQASQQLSRVLVSSSALSSLDQNVWQRCGEGGRGTPAASAATEWAELQSIAPCSGWVCRGSQL